jgi:hypothetical protein
MRLSVVTVSAAVLLGGCASSSDQVTATYVSPIQYESWKCNQLAEEAQRISRRAAIASGAQDQQRTNDQIATAAAIVIFWPAAFFVGGDRQTAAELARLKGEMEAIEQASIRKNCRIQFQHASPASSYATE